MSCAGCSYCQNWQISQWPKDHLPSRLDKQSENDALEPICPQLEALDAQVPGEPVTPAEIVRAAKQTGCLSISYTFTEPTIFYELAYDTAVLAKEQGLRYVYEVNIPGEGGENTHCYQCGALLIERHGFFVRQNQRTNGMTGYKASSCRSPIPAPHDRFADQPCRAPAPGPRR